MGLIDCTKEQFRSIILGFVMPRPLFRLIYMTKTMTNLNQRLIREVLPVTLITAVALVFFSLMMFGEPKTASAQTMCTMDARQCPDGSWVGRSGPNCQFVCPGPGGGNDGVYTNWPGTEYPGGVYEVIPLPQPTVEGDIGGVSGDIEGVPGYVDMDGNAHYGDDVSTGATVNYDEGVTNDGPVLSAEDGAYFDNSGEYNDGTYTNWPGTEHPSGSYENAVPVSNTVPPENPSFVGDVFHSIGSVYYSTGAFFYDTGNFFSGVLDWFGW